MLTIEEFYYGHSYPVYTSDNDYRTVEGWYSTTFKNDNDDIVEFVDDPKEKDPKEKIIQISTAITAGNQLVIVGLTSKGKVIQFDIFGRMNVITPNLEEINE